MATINSADPQLLGLMMLMSRMVERLLLTRTTSTSDAADLLVELKAMVDSDIDTLRLPGAGNDAAQDFKDAAKTAAGFVLARVGFNHNG